MRLLVLLTLVGCETITLRPAQLDEDNDSESSGEADEVRLEAPEHPAISIAAALHHTCAGLSNGEVRCWGRNRKNAIGTDDLVPSPREVAVYEGLGAVVTSRYQTCALADQEVHCWGTEGYTPRQSPARVAVFAGSSKIVSGGRHVCTVSETDGVRCKGLNQCHQLGTNSWRTGRVDIELVTDLAAGEEHTCARLATGQVACWGCNVGMTLGNDRVTNSAYSPHPVPGMSDATSVVSHPSAHQTCAIQDGAIHCWGFMGTSGRDGAVFTTGPQALLAIPELQSVFVGIFDVYATDAAGDLYRYQQSDASAAGEEGAPVYGPPEKIDGIANVAEVAVGLAHACARTEAGQVLCWGANTHGQLGDGTTETRSVPSPVVGLGAAPPNTQPAEEE